MLETMLQSANVSTGLAWGMPGGAEWILIALFGLLIFGKRLPEVGRSLGKGIVEFKKGLKGVEEEVEEASSTPSRPQLAQPAPQGTLPAPKFDPYTGKPIEEAAGVQNPEMGKTNP